METLGNVLKEAMRGIRVPALARKTGIKPATLNSYLQDKRKCGDENLTKILNSLVGDGPEHAKLKKRCEAAMNQPSRPATWFERLNEEGAKLRYLPFDYPPITDGRQYFIDQLLARLFNLAVIHQSQVERRGFDINGRAMAIWRGEADMLTGLCTVPRLKLLHYYPIPIKVSISAVIHKRHAKHIADLRKALAGKRPFQVKVLAVEGEVGHIHVKQSTKLNDSIVLVDDLDPRLLANRLLEEQDSQDTRLGKVPLVCCDEITAMRVLAELKTQGCLVFPPSTSDSIRECEDRKDLPAHLAGFAVSRSQTELIEYLDDAFNLLLETEVEGIAQNWFSAYRLLFERACEWLHGRLDDLSSSEELGTGREVVAERRIARGYARRVFRLTREGIESCRQRHPSWINILKRARELAQRETSRNRNDIRNRVLDISASYFGMPADWTSANINALLAKAGGDSTFEAEFRHSLAREFDIEPSNDFTVTMKMNHLEGIVSLVQRSLESDSGLTYAARVMPVLSEQLDTFKKLLREFESAVVVNQTECLTDERLAPYFSNDENSPQNAKIVLFVAQKQQIHGFLMMTADGSGSMRLERLFVRRSARRGGLGSQLVRRAIEISAELNCSRVFMNPLRFNTGKDWEDDNTKDLKSLLRHEGFKGANRHEELFEYVIKSDAPKDLSATAAASP